MSATSILIVSAECVHPAYAKVSLLPEKVNFFILFRVSAPSCSDDVRNGNETDVDCGGEACPKCIDTNVCNIHSDCISAVCEANMCQGAFIDRCCSLVYAFCFSAPSCSDSVQNGDETDVDCGGAVCLKCNDSNVCNVQSDCESGVCASNICQGECMIQYSACIHLLSFKAPICSDGVQNGNETDVDCGGEICSKCNDTKICSAHSDCMNAVCAFNICQGEYTV